MTVPIIFCIDVEPDDRLVSRDTPPPWAGYEATYEFLTHYRPRLEAATGKPVRFTWLYRLDPQVEVCYGSPGWPMTHYARQLQNLRAAGDELGLHPHAWRWDEEKSAWVADHGNQPWIDTCLRMSFDTYEEVLGKKPIAMRFGDKFYNEASSKLSEQLGMQYDLTLEPGSDAGDAIVTDGSEAYTGRLGDYSDVPTYPYRRSADDWKKPDPERKDAMWMIPLSAGLPESGRGRLKRYLKSALGSKIPPPKPMTLNASRHAGTQALIIDRILRTVPRPYLAFVIRADAVISDKRRNIEDILEYLMQHPRANEFAFSRPGDALSALGLT